MKINRMRQNVFPVLAALIWGTAFVAQSVSADHVGPFTFNAARSVVAFVFLLALSIMLRSRRNASAEVKEKGISTLETLQHSIKGHLQGIQAVLKYFAD